MKVLHVITGLNDGGAEAVLYRLIQSLPNDEHVVVSLSGFGKYGAMLRSINIEVINLNMETVRGKISAIFRLISFIKSFVPDAIQTWMYHADFIGGVAARIAGCKNITWGLHNSLVSGNQGSLSRYLLIRVNALLSHWAPQSIISCSNAALLAHKNAGYSARKLSFIPNGYPVDTFKADDKARLQVRTELGIKDDETLLGMVARYDPQKDHLNLLRALKILKKTNFFKCILVGKGLDQESELYNEIKSLGLSEDILLVGQRQDISSVMNALDIFCLSSAYSEAFPNVLCEAMACGTPCVTTDVGDSAYIVGDVGWVVPPRSPEKLASALISAIGALPDQHLQDEARRRIVDNFSIEKVASDYRSIWDKGRP